MAMIAAAARRNRRASRHRFSGKYYLLILFIAVVALTACVPYFIGVQQLSETSTFLDAWLAPEAIQQQVRAENPITTEIQDAVPQEKTVNPSYHVVFSTSCTAQQHWESYVFFYHCMRVRQPGSITRVASGCSEQDTIDAQQFHDKHIAPMAVQSTQSFELHLTPDYSHVRLAEGKFAYKYMNKPYGLRHWMENNMQLGWTDDNTTITSPYFDVKQQQHRDLLNGIVILMDPDMILLKPIGHDFSDDHELWVEKPAVTMVTHGNPISQQDGYLNNEWMKLNFTYITGDPSVKPPAWSEGPVHWNTGPPYLATMSDMYKIVSLWTETAPRVLDVYPKLFAEMYGFIIATVMLKLPFAMTQSIVVSTTSASDREGWSFVDALPDREICRIPVAATSSSAMDLTVLPTGLHYCKRYILGKWFFSKYRIKKNIMDCDKNLMKLPLDDIFPRLDYAISPPRADLKDAKTYHEVRDPINAKRAKREAFMLCGMISAVNEALRYYKQHACGRDGAPAGNLKEIYTIHDDPSGH